MKCTAIDLSTRLRFEAQVRTMQLKKPSALQLTTSIETFALRIPFAITGYTITEIACLLVTLKRGDSVGRGEAVGVYYKNDTPQKLQAEIEQTRDAIQAGLFRSSLPKLNLSSGAQNALDCALWELEAQESNTPVYASAGLSGTRPLMTTWTIGADAPERMAELAIEHRAARALKLKLLGDALDAARVREVRKVRPDVWLAVDANQGFDVKSLSALLPTLVGADVRLIEQPFPVGCDADLELVQCSIPLAADESVQTALDIPAVSRCYQYINIKLDKCGGLTEALRMAHLATALGMKLMVGNMVGTSLAMAPAFIVGQLCEVVDLDGPLLLATDRKNQVTYANGSIDCPEAVWGYRAARAPKATL